MSVVSNFMKASLFKKIVLGILVIAVAFAWTSFVTASWGDGYPGAANTMMGYGLWRRCGEGDLTSSCEDLTGWNLDWYRGVQTMAILGFVSCNACFLFILLLIFVPQCHEGKTLTVWACALAFAAALFYLIAVVIFAIGFDSTFAVTGADEDLAYGWGLSLAVVILKIISGIVMIFDVRKTGAKFMDL